MSLLSSKVLHQLHGGLAHFLKFTPEFTARYKALVFQIRKETVTAKLPVVISFVKEINEPRYPPFMGIRKASKATIPNWTAGDIGVSAPAAKADWSNVYPIPPREGEIEMIAGDTPEEQALNLFNKLFEEKVI